jgi:hypothetical protein
MAAEDDKGTKENKCIKAGILYQSGETFSISAHVEVGDAFRRYLMYVTYGRSCRGEMRFSHFDASNQQFTIKYLQPMAIAISFMERWLHKGGLKSPKIPIKQWKPTPMTGSDKVLGRNKDIS